MIFQSLCFLSCFLDRWLILTRVLLNQGFLVVKSKYAFQKLYGRHFHLINQYGVSNDHEYVPFVVIISRCVLSSFKTYHMACENITRRVPHVEQELLNIPEYMSLQPMFSGVRVVRSLVFCVMFCWSFFLLFLSIIVLSVLLRFIASHYPFGIFKTCLVNIYYF